MDGITSVHIPHATDYAGEHRVIRWTDVFFIENKDGGSREPVDVSRMAETLANAACIALTPHLDRLKEANLVKIGLRVTLETDKVFLIFFKFFEKAILMKCLWWLHHFTVFGFKFIALAQGSLIEIGLQLVNYLKTCNNDK